ncbi:MAG TPA: alanine/glycine:cation symporter family protein [Streptosporangiaceae bacterium]
MDFIQANLIDPVSHFLYTYILIYVLLGAGIYFTVCTRFVQIRRFPGMFRLMISPGGAAGGISSFQAFCVGLASRVGTGNIAGVAIALTLGGPGAIFWMWVVALVGMATGFVEATLAQIFKVTAADGSFRGGPAYYIQRGLRSRPGGVLFAVLLLFTFGIAFNMVQANTVADVLVNAHSITEGWTAMALVVLAAPVLFGGVKRIASVSGYVLPVMALAYILIALIIIGMHINLTGHTLRVIVDSAFGVGPAAAGVAGGVSAAMLNGIKRGLFSNEAGMGSAPNAAATATTDHPAKQGLIQSLGVFVDTMCVSTATALIILFSGVYTPGKTSESAGASLTQAALTKEFGTAGTWLMTVLVCVFAFSSVLGNYSYAEVNLDYLGASKAVIYAFRLVVLGAVALGSVVALNLVWAFADVSMGVMALVNLTAIVLLSRWAFGALKDYDASLAAGLQPRFTLTGNPRLPAGLRSDAWP